MVTAILMMMTERGAVNRVAQTLVEIDGVSEVYSVSGKYDLIAMVRVSDNDRLAELVTDRIAAVQGITSSETVLAFRAFSTHDLESLFAIGFEEPGNDVMPG